MSVIHIRRIKAALHKLFDGGLIDMSDQPLTRSADDTERAFLSRALAAYALHALAESEPRVAAAHITDGFDDNGIDAVLFERERKRLYVVQAKWIDDGNGSISLGDCKKFTGGFRDLLVPKFDKFGPRLRQHQREIEDALQDSDVELMTVLIHTGNQSESSHVSRELTDLLTEVNNPVEVLTHKTLNQSGIYSSVAGNIQVAKIALEIMLREYGHADDPYDCYYGQVDASSLAEWWRRYGSSLLIRNLRHYRGSTDVNVSLVSTLLEHPEHFLYFNNGVTILCNAVKKRPVGGPSRDSAVFDCTGVSIVNGAQTIGAIGAAADASNAKVQQARVFVRLISLERCPSGFDKEVTTATNTQNRIEKRDFAALDANQERLANEMRLDGRRYSYKTGEPDPSPHEGCSIVEATVALACAANDVSLAVQAKREIGKLWEDIESKPYTLLFNEDTSATEVWRAVHIMRTVEQTLTELKGAEAPRADMVAVHGNRFILYRVFADSRLRGFRAESTSLESLGALAQEATRDVFYVLTLDLEEHHENAYLATLFKNAQKCRALDERMTAAFALREVPNRMSEPDVQRGDGTLFPLDT